MNKKTYLCEATMWMKKKVCIFIKIVFFAYLQKILLKNVNFLLIKPLCGYIKIHILHNSIFLGLLKGVIFFFFFTFPSLIYSFWENFGIRSTEHLQNAVIWSNWCVIHRWDIAKLRVTKVKYFGSCRCQWKVFKIFTSNFS